MWLREKKACSAHFYAKRLTRRVMPGRDVGAFSRPVSEGCSDDLLLGGSEGRDGDEL